MGRSIIVTLAVTGLLIAAACTPGGQSQSQAREGAGRQDTQSTQDGGPGLPVGEYSCADAHMNSLLGMSFKVVAPGQYTDLDGKTQGSFEVHGTTISFRGGHLDGQTFSDLTSTHSFQHEGTYCGPWK